MRPVQLSVGRGEWLVRLSGLKAGIQQHSYKASLRIHPFSSKTMNYTDIFTSSWYLFYNTSTMNTSVGGIESITPSSSPPMVLQARIEAAFHTDMSYG